MGMADVPVAFACLLVFGEGACISKMRLLMLPLQLYVSWAPERLVEGQ
jgi:hypothetical protein